jgi:hypothetical protein
MLIAGEWFVSNDGIARPVLSVDVAVGDNERQAERFLLDSGADRTVFSRGLLSRLQVSGTAPPTGQAVFTAMGAARFVVVQATLAFAAAQGRPAIVHGEFAAFTQESTLEMSILGRDVLDNFDVILSRRRDEVLLLSGNHYYQVSPG